MNSMEESFIKTFITRDRRERWLSLLGSEKTRAKLLGRLAHVLEADLDYRYVYAKEQPPLEIKSQSEDLLKEWKKTNPKQLCHIIVNGSAKDGTLMNLAEAESDYDLTFGVIIIVIPEKLAYYHPERDNISMQPFKLLLHP